MHKRKSLFLFQSNYIKLQSVVPSITSRKYIIQAVPSKIKRKKKWEGEGKERGGKEEKRKKGWKEFVRKERERGERDVEEKMKKKEKEKEKRKKKKTKNGEGDT